MQKPDKSELTRELEKKYLKKEDYSGPPPTDLNNAYIIDIMAYLRRLEKQAKSSQDIKTFGDLSRSFLLWIKKLCVAAERIDFIFDTYVTELSVKDSERARVR